MEKLNELKNMESFKEMLNPARITQTMTMFIESGQKEIV
jgi:hypothetical protein